jgi:DNA-binding response OmpR family regulator
MLTADGGKDSEAKARTLGATDFVSKPFTPETLVAAVTRYIPVGAPAAA